SNLLAIKDTHPMARNFDCEVIVLEKEDEVTRTRDGDLIHRFLVADKTGSITLSVWGEIGGYIHTGDILRINGGCKIKRIGQDTFPFNEKPNMSENLYQNQIPGTFHSEQQSNNLQQQSARNEPYQP
ncbi:hypothetical protein BDF20DRAFT_800145, partial [Mycotypha africana]|uniref:uncharacterized protein n=1 Tax=Mycotypha africana TaxID=64632 RepID=UPI0023001EB3